MKAERARILFEPERAEVPGSFNMVEIRTGGDRLLRRLRTLCGELASGERAFCDLLRELPAEGVWVREFRAHLGRTKGEKIVAISVSPDRDTADVDWRNAQEGWERVCERIDKLLDTPGENVIMTLYGDDDDEADLDGVLSVER